MVAVYPEGIKERDLDRQDSLWYQNDMNPIATVVHEGREASVYCLGDVRVRVGDFVYRNVNEVIDFGIHDDDALAEAEERGDIEFLNNNWFEIIDAKSDDVTGLISHSLEDAIYSAEAYVTGVYA
jgi:hypothetical protein